MENREAIVEEVRQQMMEGMMAFFQQDKQKHVENFRQQNKYIQKGQTLFTGSSLMEQFPITEYCMTEGLPIAYNRGIGGFTTDEFLANADVMLLEPQPAKLFINIGTNDIALRQDGSDWLDHLTANLKAIYELIRTNLQETKTYVMAYYPSNEEKAAQNPGFSIRTNENIRRANEAVQKLAGEYGFSYIDVNDGLKDENGALKADYTMDGIHFCAEAYHGIFERLKQYL